MLPASQANNERNISYSPIRIEVSELFTAPLPVVNGAHRALAERRRARHRKSGAALFHRRSMPASKASDEMSRRTTEIEDLLPPMYRARAAGLHPNTRHLIIRVGYHLPAFVKTSQSARENFGLRPALNRATVLINTSSIQRMLRVLWPCCLRLDLHRFLLHQYRGPSLGSLSTSGGPVFNRRASVSFSEAVHNQYTILVAANTGASSIVKVMFIYP
jgi:hypothetical protein